MSLINKRHVIIDQCHTIVQLNRWSSMITEHFRLEVALYTCTLWVLGSKLGRYTRYPDSPNVFELFSSPFTKKLI
jgi:hypothetical protein